MCFAPSRFHPSYFSARCSCRPGGEAGSDGVIYFSERLLQAAAECGKLEELVTAAESAGKSLTMADTLSILTGLVLQRDEHLAEQTADFVQSLRQRVRTTGKLKLEPWPTYMVARTWMRLQGFHSQGESLAELLAAHVTGTQQRSFVSHLHRDLASYRVQQFGGTLTAEQSPGLALWHPGGYYFTSGSQAGTWPGWWVERDNMLVHLSGPEVSPLYFDCPLVGEFAVSVDAYVGTAHEAAVQYGRIVCEPLGQADKARVLTIGERESIEAPILKCTRDGSIDWRSASHPRRSLISAMARPCLKMPSRVRRLRGWLCSARCTRKTAWCNLQLTGNPQIPREVSLIQGDRMDGWMSPLYRENVPRQLRPAEASAGGAAAAAAKQGYVWYAADSVLHGAAMKSPNATPPSSRGWPTTGRCAAATRSRTSSSTSPARRWCIRGWAGWRSSWNPPVCDSIGSPKCPTCHLAD